MSRRQYSLVFSQRVPGHANRGRGLNLLMLPSDSPRVQDCPALGAHDAARLRASRSRRSKVAAVSSHDLRYGVPVDQIAVQKATDMT